MSRRGYRGKGNRVTHNRTSGGNSPLKQPQVMFLASLGIVAALLIRYQFIDFKSNDYNAFLSHWLQYFRDNGGFSALGKRIGDYNVPYLYFMALFSYIPVSGLYLIKLLSVIFDILLAYTAMKLVTLLTNRNDFGVAAFILVLLLPTVTLNSMWGQCDSIYISWPACTVLA